MKRWQRRLLILLSIGIVALGVLQLVPYRVTNHVKEGRAKLNFSEWGTRKQEADDAAEVVTEGSMPPDYYTWLGMHSDAKLTPAERRELATGLQKSLGGG